MRFLPERLRWFRGAAQYAALPYRFNTHGDYQLMLVTSRSTGRWIIPKGWPIAGLAPHLSAAREAYEEAGVRGEAGAEPIGVFRHRKTLTGRMLDVTVYPLAVTEELDRWPERFQRQRRWFTLSEAAYALTDRSLRRIVQSFRPPPVTGLEQGSK